MCATCGGIGMQAVKRQEACLALGLQLDKNSMGFSGAWEQY
jgi:hypothetical protein